MLIAGTPRCGIIGLSSVVVDFAMSGPRVLGFLRSHVQILGILKILREVYLYDCFSSHFFGLDGRRSSVGLLR